MNSERSWPGQCKRLTPTSISKPKAGLQVADLWPVLLCPSARLLAQSESKRVTTHLLGLMDRSQTTFVLGPSDQMAKGPLSNERSILHPHPCCLQWIPKTNRSLSTRSS